MSSRFRAMAAGLAAACFLTSMAGCVAANRTPQGTMPSGTLTRQGTNLSQDLTRGTMPNTMMPGTRLVSPAPGTNLVSPAPGTSLVSPAPGRMSLPPLAFDTRKADHIMANIGHVDGARSIKAVVNGNTALVAYTPSGTLRNTLATKSAIAKRVKTIDRTVTNVVVSEKTDIMNRITKLSNDARNNRLGTDFNSTFNQLVRRAKGS